MCVRLLEIIMIKTLFLGKHTGGHNHCLGIDALTHLLNHKDFDVVRCGVSRRDSLYNFCLLRNIDIECPFTQPEESIPDLDLIVCYGFGSLLTQPLISSPRMGCINFHPAPLPAWRGMGGVFNIGLYENIEEWGCAAHFVDEAFDTGDLIKSKPFAINPRKETPSSLAQKSHQNLLELFREVMDTVSHNQQSPHLIPRAPQGDGRYISTAEFNKVRRVHPTDSTEVIDKKIRCFFSPPHHGAFIQIGKKEYSLINSEILKTIRS